MTKRKLDAKTFAQQKRNRRRLLTFMRMCSYGMHNFRRNAWLSLAATGIMVITLLVVFMTMSARNVLLDTVGEIKNKVDMSIYIKTDTPQKDVETIQADLQKLPSVRSVAYVSPDAARAQFAADNKGSASTLDALNQATNQFPGTFRIKAADINDTTELKHFTDTDATYLKNKDPNREASFAGERKSAIASIGRWVTFAQNGGLVASIIFVAISSLIVFNTIRMAIFNRKDEIEMMKLIGADRSFIRGPFIVEAIVYGCLAAIVATTIGVALLYTSSEQLLSYGIVIKSTVDFMTKYVVVVLITMMLLGSVIGVMSSLFATRKYLKI
jgi:cell division transport system permease protein